MINRRGRRCNENTAEFIYFLRGANRPLFFLNLTNCIERAFN